MADKRHKKDKLKREKLNIQRARLHRADEGVFAGAAQCSASGGSFLWFLLPSLREGPTPTADSGRLFLVGPQRLGAWGAGGRGRSPERVTRRRAPRCVLVSPTPMAAWLRSIHSENEGNPTGRPPTYSSGALGPLSGVGTSSPACGASSGTGQTSQRHCHVFSVTCTGVGVAGCCSSSLSTDGPAQGVPGTTHRMPVASFFR